MNLEWSLTVAGLSIDIVGNVVLFVMTSARRVEAGRALFACAPAAQSVARQVSL